MRFRFDFIRFDIIKSRGNSFVNKLKRAARSPVTSSYQTLETDRPARDDSRSLGEAEMRLTDSSTGDMILFDITERKILASSRDLVALQSARQSMRNKNPELKASIISRSAISLVGTAASYEHVYQESKKKLSDLETHMMRNGTNRCLEDVHDNLSEHIWITSEILGKTDFYEKT